MNCSFSVSKDARKRQQQQMLQMFMMGMMNQITGPRPAIPMIPNMMNQRGGRQQQNDEGGPWECIQVMMRTMERNLPLRNRTRIT